MTLKEFQDKVKSGQVSLGSKLAMRNENIQRRDNRKTYERLQRAKSKVSRILIPKEIALDFDPACGMETDEFNEDHKFRPLMTPSSLALILKEYANTVPETKQRLMSKSGVSDWDTSDVGTLTEMDKKVFRPYLYPVIFTLPVFNVKLKTMSNNQWGRDYLIRVQRDPITNRVVGEVPLPLKANYFYASVAQEEINELEERVKNKIEDYTDQQLQQKRSDIREARIMVSGDRPSNWLRVIEIDVIPRTLGIDQGKFSLADATKDSTANCIRMTRYTKELQNTVDKYRNGNWELRDTNFDFYEVNMVCPVSGDKPADIGRETRYEKPDLPISEEAGFDNFLKQYNELFSDDEDAEKTVWASTRICEYDEDVERRLREALSLGIDLKSKYVTDNVILRNKDFITEIFGERGDHLIMMAEEDISGKKAGGPGVPGDAATRREYDLDAMEQFSEEDLGLEMTEQ